MGFMDTINNAIGGSGVGGMLGFGMDLLNYKNQRDVFKYNKNLQQTMFDREDDAVQRRAKDMEAAGLSKTLAAGDAAQAGSAIPVESPQAKMEQSQAAMNMMMQKANIARTAAETEFTRQKINTEKETTKIRQAEAVLKKIEADIQKGGVQTESGFVTYEEFKRSQYYNESRQARQNVARGEFDAITSKFAAEIERQLQENLKVKYPDGIPDEEIRATAAFSRWVALKADGTIKEVQSRLDLRDEDIYGAAYSGIPTNQQAGNVSKEVLAAASTLLELMQKQE